MSDSTHHLAATLAGDDTPFGPRTDSASLLPSIALAAAVLLLGLIIVGAAIP